MLLWSRSCKIPFTLSCMGIGETVLICAIIGPYCRSSWSPNRNCCLKRKRAQLLLTLDPLENMSLGISKMQSTSRSLDWSQVYLHGLDWTWMAWISSWIVSLSTLSKNLLYDFLFPSLRQITNSICLSLSLWLLCSKKRSAWLHRACREKNLVYCWSTCSLRVGSSKGFAKSWLCLLWGLQWNRSQPWLWDSTIWGSHHWQPRSQGRSVTCAYLPDRRHPWAQYLLQEWKTEQVWIARNFKCPPVPPNPISNQDLFNLKYMASLYKHGLKLKCLQIPRRGEDDSLMLL